MGFCCMIQGTQMGALYQPTGVWKGREVEGRFKKEGTHVYLWLINVDIWQKPTQYCKAIILLLNLLKGLSFPQ